MGTGGPYVQARPVHDHREGQAAADRLGQDHHVGHHPGVVDAPEGSGPADSRLYLVGDEGDPPGRGDLTHAAQPGVRGGVDPALALHRFDDQACRQGDTALGVVEEVLRPAGGEFGSLRAPDAERAAEVLRVGKPGHPDLGSTSRGVQGAGAHAVVGPGEGEQSGAPGRGADQFEGGFDGVRAGGPAELDARVGGQSRRQVGEQLRGEGVLDRCREVQHVKGCPRVEDTSDGFEHHRVVVSEREGAGAGEAVEVTAAVGAFDGQPAGPYRDDGQGAGVGPGGGLPLRLPAQNAVVTCCAASLRRHLGLRLRRGLCRGRRPDRLAESHERRSSRTDCTYGLPFEHQRSPRPPYVPTTVAAADHGWTQDPCQEVSIRNH